MAKATEEVWAEAEAWVDAEAKAEDEAWARLDKTLKQAVEGGDEGEPGQDGIELLLTQVRGAEEEAGGLQA